MPHRSGRLKTSYVGRSGVKGGGGGNLLPAKQFCRDELSVEEDGFDTARALECSASQLAFHILENDLGQNAQAYQYLPGLSGSKSVRQVARSATLKKPVASVEKLHRSADLAKIGQASRERPRSLNKPDIFPEVHGLTLTHLLPALTELLGRWTASITSRRTAARTSLRACL